MLARKLMGGAGAEEKLYVDDVFSTFLYTGNGSTQTITNGIDLAGEGGLVWTKNRNNTATHVLIDTVRGNTSCLLTPYAQAATTKTDKITSFTSNGYSLGSDLDSWINYNTYTYVSWTFRRAPKFFDVVTGSGIGTFSHSLGQIPGMIILKKTNGVSNWFVGHRSVNGYLSLNDTAATTGTASFNTLFSATSSTFSTSYFLAGGDQWVAYLFAHDTATDGMIQCGSFTTDGMGDATVTLGWEPQYVIIKKSSAASNWFIFNAISGMPVSGSQPKLIANTSDAESTGTPVAYPNATGFKGSSYSMDSTYIYLAIRRPNKPPTSGTQVYNAIARTGTGAAATVTGIGFAPDHSMTASRSVTTEDRAWFTRLRGDFRYLFVDASTEGGTTTGFKFTGASGTMEIVNLNNINRSGTTFIDHFFRRAPGFFDVVCKDDTGSSTTVEHQLGVIPELIIQKRRDDISDWQVGYASSSFGQRIRLNFSDAEDALAYFNTVGASSFVATAGVLGRKRVYYLFATLAGISKVGSYTGNGSSQTINCGFSAGARFVLIKRTDSTGDWYVWDSVRGIIAANDPHLSLNTTAAEVTTDDSVDPDNSGFIVNQVAATNINVTSASYIYLAIA